jgi:RNA recognition motif-containing protein
MTKRLYVGNLGFQTSAGELQELFQPHGTVVSVDVVMDRATGTGRGFAFVEMGDELQANAAIAALGGAQLGGRTLTVSAAKPRAGRPGA